MGPMEVIVEGSGAKKSNKIFSWKIGAEVLSAEISEGLFNRTVLRKVDRHRDADEIKRCRGAGPHRAR